MVCNRNCCTTSWYVDLHTGVEHVLGSVLDGKNLHCISDEIVQACMQELTVLAPLRHPTGIKEKGVHALHTYNNTYTDTHGYMHAYIHTHTYLQTDTQTYTHVNTYIHTYIHTYIYTCINTYIHTHTHTHTHTHIHAHTHIHVYMLQ